MKTKHIMTRGCIRAIAAPHFVTVYAVIGREVKFIVNDRCRAYASACAGHNFFYHTGAYLRAVCFP